jgi:long-chain acyl-CoA synthetase
MDIEAYLDDLRGRQAAARPAGVATKPLYPIGERTLPEHVAHWAEQRPDQAAFVFDDVSITYRQLHESVRGLAGWLDSAGVAPGDRVAVFLPNCPQFVVTMLAVLSLGAVHVPVNPMFQQAELAHELADSGACLVVTDEQLLPLVEEVQSGTAVRQVLVTATADATLVGSDASPDEHATAFVRALRHEALPPRTLDYDALAALNYTGGTTGMPKGCEHTHRHMIYTAASSAAATGLKADGSFVALCYIPIFWIAGEDLGILNPLVLGGTCVLLPRWDVTRVLPALERHGVTTMVGTVENYLELLDRPDFAEYDLSGFTDPLAVSFVRKMSPEVRQRWVEAVGRHSVLREGAYGMTETHTMDATPYGLAQGDRDLLAEPVYCGLPVPGTDIAVVAFEDGEPLPLGEHGEIIVRSPSVMSGYWQRPDATAAQLRDGWLHTGDIGMINQDGGLHYLGRDKDMIKVNGMSVFPTEVETLLSRHPDVQTVAVVPAADPDKGQRPVAFVSARPGTTVDADELRGWARQQMSTYKVPLIHLIDDFPTTTTGKIRKVELLEQAQALADNT